MTGPVVVSRPTSTRDRPAPQMPPLPNKEDINATWEYLEFGINRVMNHFTSGIDMQSVSSVSLVHPMNCHVYLRLLLTMPALSLLSTWAYIREFVSSAEQPDLCF